MGGASLAKLVGQKVILADGFCAIVAKIGRYNVGVTLQFNIPA